MRLQFYQGVKANEMTCILPICKSDDLSGLSIGINHILAIGLGGSPIMHLLNGNIAQQIDLTRCVLTRT